MMAAFKFCEIIPTSDSSQCWPQLIFFLLQVVVVLFLGIMAEFLLYHGCVSVMLVDSGSYLNLSFHQATTLFRFSLLFWVVVPIAV